MAQVESPLGVAIVDAVKGRMKYEASNFKSRTEWEKKSMAHALEARDEAAASRARYEQCKTFLDENVPDWMLAVPSEETEHYVLYPTEEPASAST